MNQLQKVKILKVSKNNFIFNRGIIFYLFDKLKTKKQHNKVTLVKYVNLFS